MLIFAVVLALLLGSPAAALGQGARHFREAWEAGQRQDFDGAIMYYTRAIESGDLPHPDLFFAFNNRGNAYAGKRDYDRAIRDYSEALRLNPKYAAAFRNRGRALVHKGDYDRAIADYNEAARIDPEDPHALIGRGIAYNAKHQYDLAIRDFDAALRVCPACPLAVLNRAAAYVAKGDDGRAIQEFDVALQQSPGDPNVYVGRAAVYEVRGSSTERSETLTLRSASIRRTGITVCVAAPCTAAKATMPAPSRTSTRRSGWARSACRHSVPVGGCASTSGASPTRRPISPKRAMRTARSGFTWPGREPAGTGAPSLRGAAEVWISPAGRERSSRCTWGRPRPRTCSALRGLPTRASRGSRQLRHTSIWASSRFSGPTSRRRGDGSMRSSTWWGRTSRSRGSVRMRARWPSCGDCRARLWEPTPVEPEPRPREVTVEAHRRGAPRRLHDGEADGVRVIDGPASQPFEPEPRRSVMLGGGELDDREGARLEPVQRARRRPCARPEEQEPVHLGEDQVRGDQTDALRRRAAKHRVRFSVVAVARAQQRNPGAAIDEQPIGRAASGPGAGPISPQRTPPGGTGRTARCSLAGVHRSSRSAPARDPRRPGW